MSMELDDFKRLTSGEVTDLTDCIQAIALDRKIDVTREFIYNLIEKTVEKIHAKKFAEKKGVFNIW